LESAGYTNVTLYSFFHAEARYWAVGTGVIHRTNQEADMLYPSLCTPLMDRNGTIPLAIFPDANSKNVYGVQYARLLFFPWCNSPTVLRKANLQRVPSKQRADPEVGID
jgi:hypothetical protein